MEKPHRIEIGEVYVAQTDRALGDISGLYSHQVGTIESSSDVIVLDAPTGSGKTLAALARILQRGQSAIFLYPTNALVKDQVRSIVDLLERMGYQAELIDSEWDPANRAENTSQDCVDVIHITGETLEVLADGKAKGTILERILKGTDTSGRVRILLTNPDTLYLVNAGMYNRPGLIADQLFKFPVLVVDELHLYSGPTLARLIFMLNEYRGSPSNPLVDLVFLSATHGDTLNLLVHTYPSLDLIQVQPLTCNGPNRRRIRYRTMGEVHTQTKVLYEDKDVDRIAGEVVALYESPYTWSKGTAEVKVLAILSSVTFAVAVARRAKEILSEKGYPPDQIVHQYHGLIPRRERPRIETLSEAILVGTSAIEVGVDFNVPFLVMEAHDLASFLQRFGRGGRHSACEFVLYVPQPMADRLRSRISWSFPDFTAEAQAAFHELPSYAGFLASRQVKGLLLAMALAGSKTYDFYRGRKNLNIKEAIGYFRQLVRFNSCVSVGGANLGDVMDQLDDKELEMEIEQFVVEVMANHSFVRGAMNSILVGLPGVLLNSETDLVISELDIFDVFRLEGELVPAGKEWNRVPKSVRRRYTKEDPMFVVKSLNKHSWPRATVAPHAYARKTVSVFLGEQTSILADSPRLTQVTNALLERRNLVYFWRGMNRTIDYRIPRVNVEGENGALVIGDWALVAEYLNKREEAR